MKLKINTTYQKLVPPLQKDELQKLEESIKNIGQRVNIISNESGEILDGIHRFIICKKLNKEPKYEMQKFLNKLQEKIWVVENLLARRHLNDFQKAELGMVLLEIESALAGKRRATHAKAPYGAFGKSTEKVSKKIGMSRNTFERAKVVIEKAPEHIKARTRTGSLSITSAYKLITSKERNLPKQELPLGEYDVILADPPWKFEMENVRGSAEHHYTTMTDKELEKLKIPCSKNCILFLWVPNSLIFHAKQMLDVWGFEYKTHFVWIKTRIVTGSWLRNQHELLFIAIKGAFPTPSYENLYSSVIRANETKHSKKPEVVYEMIETMYPKRRYLELFARNKRSGWVSWGDEI